jgi:hypothetical protein
MAPGKSVPSLSFISGARERNTRGIESKTEA